jgi:hypothetical protein
MVSAIYQAGSSSSLIYKFSCYGLICVAVSCTISTQQLTTKNYFQVFKQSKLLDKFRGLDMLHM